MNRSTGLVLFGLATCIALALCPSPGTLAQPPQAAKAAATESVAPLTGHIIARVEYLTGYLTNLLGGEKYDVFIFGTGSQGKKPSPLVPVKIVYQFWPEEPKLPETFFNFARLYELKSAVRDTKCDESVKSLSYQRNVTESGQELPPTLILKILDGAPTGALKPNLVLPCYYLRPGGYKLLGQVGPD